MKKIIYFVIVIFMLSCTTSNTIYKKPENLIPKDTMLSLLTDMYIASSAKFTKNKLLQKDINYMMLVYDKYKIDSTRFKISNRYYTSKIEEHYDMLEEVKKRLELKRDKLNKELDKADSTKVKREKLKDPEKLDTLIKPQ